MFYGVGSALTPVPMTGADLATVLMEQGEFDAALFEKSVPCCCFCNTIHPPGRPSRTAHLNCRGLSKRNKNDPLADLKRKPESVIVESVFESIPTVKENVESHFVDFVLCQVQSPPRNLRGPLDPGMTYTEPP